MGGDGGMGTIWIKIADHGPICFFSFVAVNIVIQVTLYVDCEDNRQSLSVIL